MRLDEQRDAPWQQQCTNDDVLNINCWLSHSMNPTTVANLNNFFFYFEHHTHSQYTTERVCFFFCFSSIQYLQIGGAHVENENVIKPVRVTYYYNLAKIIMRFSINTKYYIMGAAMFILNRF